MVKRIFFQALGFSLPFAACGGTPAETTGTTQLASSTTAETLASSTGKDGPGVPTSGSTADGSSAMQGTDEGAVTSTSTTGGRDPGTSSSGSQSGFSSGAPIGEGSSSPGSSSSEGGDTTTGGQDCDPEKTLVADAKIVLAEPADVQALAGIECIDGQIQLYGSAGSLQALKSLRKISFSLGVYGDGFTEGLLGLENLEYVGEGITISTTDLVDLSGLEGLKQAGWVNLHLNSKLVSVDGLDGLQHVQEGLYLGSFLYGVNHNLASVEALSALQDVGGDFEIYGTNLESLQGLEQLESVGGYAHIQGNKKLPNCLAQAFLANVKVAGAVEINSNLADQCGG